MVSTLPPCVSYYIEALHVQWYPDLFSGDILWMLQQRGWNRMWKMGADVAFYRAPEKTRGHRWTCWGMCSHKSYRTPINWGANSLCTCGVRQNSGINVISIFHWPTEISGISTDKKTKYWEKCNNLIVLYTHKKIIKILISHMRWMVCLSSCNGLH